MKLDNLKNYKFDNNEKMLLSELKYYINGIELHFLKRKFICDENKFEKIISNLSKKGFIELYTQNNIDFIKIKD